MNHVRVFTALPTVIGLLGLSLTPCPETVLPSVGMSAAEAAEPVHRVASAPEASAHSHHMHDVDGSEAVAGHAHHDEAPAVASRGSLPGEVVAAPCPCGCSQRAQTGRAPLSVGDFAPPEVSMLVADGVAPMGRLEPPGPPAVPVQRVFHVPIPV